MTTPGQRVNWRQKQEEVQLRNKCPLTTTPKKRDL